MTESHPASAYKSAHEDTLRFIREEADKRLSAQLTLMTAADSRANGILAAATALGAAGFALAADQYANNVALGAGAIVFGSLASLSAVAAVAALWPTLIEPVGAGPRIFVDDVAAAKDFTTIQCEMLKILDDRILKNRRKSRRLARFIRLAMALLVLAPISAGLAVLVWPAG